MTVNKYAYKKCDHYVENLPLEFIGGDDDVIGFGVWYAEVPSTLNSMVDVVLKFNGKPVLQSDPFWGWDLVKNPLTVLPNKYLLQLRRGRKLVLESFTLSYYTSQADCLKCKSLGHLFELQVVNAGEFKRALGSTKLIQELTVFIMTRLGSLHFFDWLGTPITEISGSKFDPVFSPAFIELEIVKAIEKYQSLQQQQAALQDLDPAERYSNVISLQRVPEEEEETSIIYELVIRNSAADILEIPLLIRFS